MTRLELLLKAYIEITQLWSKMPVGESASRMWKSAEFLERLIKKEVDAQWES